MDTRMDRRSFLKNAALAGAALVVAPVALGTVEPQAALADEAATPKTGTCTCNVRVNYSDHKIALVGKDAYMTDSSTPGNGGFPTTPASGNASWVEDGVGYLVTVDLVNTMFTLTTINDACLDDEDAKITNKVGSPITQLTVWVPDEGTCSFTATEHAGYLPYLGDKSWPVRIIVEGLPQDE